MIRFALGAKCGWPSTPPVGAGPADVASKLLPLLDDPDAKRALTILERDFSEPDAVGPMRVADFVTGGKDAELQADVVGFIGRLLAKVKSPI